MASSSTSSASKTKETVNDRFIHRMIQKYHDSFLNVSYDKPIIEKGSDGNCLFYSILHAENRGFHSSVGIEEYDQKEKEIIDFLESLEP